MYAIACRREQRGYQGMERRGIALYVGFDIERLASEHDGDAMISNRTVQQDFVSRLQMGLSKWPGSTKNPHASRVDEEPIGLAALDHLGVPGDDGDARFSGSCRHRRYDAAQVGDGEAFLQDKAGREI